MQVGPRSLHPAWQPHPAPCRGAGRASVSLSRCSPGARAGGHAAVLQRPGECRVALAGTAGQRPDRPGRFRAASASIPRSSRGVRAGRANTPRMPPLRSASWVNHPPAGSGALLGGAPGTSAQGPEARASAPLPAVIPEVLSDTSPPLPRLRSKPWWDGSRSIPAGDGLGFSLTSFGPGRPSAAFGLPQLPLTLLWEFTGTWKPVREGTRHDALAPTPAQNSVSPRWGRGTALVASCSEPSCAPRVTVAE